MRMPVLELELELVAAALKQRIGELVSALVRAGNCTSAAAVAWVPVRRWAGRTAAVVVAAAVRLLGSLEEQQDAEPVRVAGADTAVHTAVVSGFAGHSSAYSGDISADSALAPASALKAVAALVLALLAAKLPVAPARLTRCTVELVEAERHTGPVGLTHSGPHAALCGQDVAVLG
jgi:hypothetical protein